jgi:DNA-binding SARP family transcriptional activator/ABC-type glycerol-3-phosphate transport system substrate-binding protein
MEIRVLGPLGVLEGGRQIALGGRRQRSVLAGLLIHAGEPVATTRLIEIVWGAAPPPTARKSLQTYVSRLRRSLGDGSLTSVVDGYVLEIGPDQLDAARFEQLAERGRRLLATDPGAAWTTLTEALGLWRGTPLSDIEPEGDVYAYVARLQETRLAAIEDRVDAGLALGRHRELSNELRGLVEAHPYRERLGSQLIVALYRSGRQTEALEAHQRTRRTLADELGLEPSLAFRRLETRILQQDPGLDHAPAAATATPAAAGAAAATAAAATSDVTSAAAEPTLGPPPRRNPYKGLRAFGADDAGDFFGREALVEQVLARIDAGARFLALVGPSGSGKSSVALAGVAPALRTPRAGKPGRLAARMNPGTHPFAQLEAALHRAAPSATTPTELDDDDDLALLRAVLRVVPDERSELLLVIDQFEELLTGTVAETTVRSFVRNLVEAVEDPHGQLLVVITLRSDFFDEALRQPELAGLLDSGTVNVPPLSPVELQAAVVRPARAVGLLVEPELAAELITETAQHPSALPLLQFVLTELTDQAVAGSLTLAALHRAGGIRGTLAQRAEQLYGLLSSDGQEAARRLFLHLVALNEVGEPTRRVAIVDELVLPGVEDRSRTGVLDALVDGRLLTYGREPGSGRATVEVTHEAVLRAWPRCERWVEAATADIRLALELERAAADWVAADRSADYLLTGSRLRAVEDRAPTSELVPSPRAEGFLQASLARREEVHRAEAERAERERALERRAVRRLRVSVAILALLVGITTVLTAFAVARSNEAGRQRTVALDAASEVLVRQLTYAAVAEAGRDPERSLLLALHAVRVASIRDDPVARETVEALHWGLQARGVQYPVADGRTLLLVGASGTRGAFDLPARELVALAQANVSRQLTIDECRTFLPSGGCPALPHDLARGLSARKPIAVGQEDQPLAGTTVDYVSFAAEDAALRAEFNAFTAETGIKVVHNESSSLYELMEAGEIQPRADLIVVPQPGSVASEAAAERLVDIGRYLSRDAIVSDYGAHLAAMGTVGPDGRFGSETGTLHAVPFGGNVKSLIWYLPERFEEAGYEVPTTWDDLIALSDRIVADGGTPWCFAEESGPASGWPATDWVEDLLLREAGPEVYDGWVAGDIPFSDPRVRRAFERLGELAFSDGYVHGGIEAATSTSFTTGFWPMFDDPPGCWLFHFPSFIISILPPGIEAGDELSAFVTPTIDPEHAEGIVGQFGFLLVYSDRPEVRELVRWLTGPEYGRLAVESEPLFIAMNRRFDADRYPEGWRRAAAEALGRAQASDHARNDGSDSMPAWLGTKPIWTAMIDYLRGGPDSLDGILRRLDELEPPDEEDEEDEESDS